MKVTMVRGVGSRMPQSTMSPSSVTNWGPFLDTRGSPPSSSDGERGSPYAWSGHMPHSSSACEHSLSEGHQSQPEGDGEGLGSWPEALLRQNTDNDNGAETSLPYVLILAQEYQR